MAVPSKTEIAAYWAVEGAKRRLHPGFVDLKEPACFACNWHLRRWDKSKEPWEAAKGLQRAHIVARSQHGSDDLSNLVILCTWCHERAPMTTHPSDMFQWMARQEHFLARQVWELCSELAKQGFEQADWMLVQPLLDNGTLGARMRKIVKASKIGLHTTTYRGPIMTTGTTSIIVGKLFTELRKGHRAPRATQVSGQR
jgi:hypothetical protein